MRLREMFQASCGIGHAHSGSLCTCVTWPIMAPPSACNPTLYGQADLKPCNPEQNLRLPNMGSMSNTSWHLQPMAAW